jgi:hypothetical protein
MPLKFSPVGDPGDCNVIIKDLTSFAPQHFHGCPHPHEFLKPFEGFHILLLQLDILSPRPHPNYDENKVFLIFPFIGRFFFQVLVAYMVGA